jgi:hypothetical protein
MPSRFSSFSQVRGNGSITQEYFNAITGGINVKDAPTIRKSLWRKSHYLIVAISLLRLGSSSVASNSDSLISLPDRPECSICRHQLPGISTDSMKTITRPLERGATSRRVACILPAKAGRYGFHRPLTSKKRALSGTKSPSF